MTVPENSEQVKLPPINKRDSSLAIASLVAGLLAWVVVPFFGALAAVITGHLAKKEIRESQGALSGDGMALAGLILGYTQLGLFLLVVFCIFAFVLAIGAGSTSTWSGTYTSLPGFLSIL
jgi:hypothetical protein